MAGTARFAFAHDADGNDIRATNADKLCKTYRCRQCQRPVTLCYGDIVTTRHFRHKVREWAPGEHCDYNDETYAHRHAKAILQQRKWVAVPPVLPRRAEGYEGPIVPLKAGRVVNATHVYNECTLYEDELCGLSFVPRKHDFKPEQGQRDFVCRPDVVFTDENDHLVLLIEIHVTHEVDYKKLVGLRRAQVDTIEITIPWFLTSKEIENLLASHARTKWLYNHERETTDPVGRDAAGLAPMGGDDCEEAPALGPDSIDCQLHEIREAVRSLKKFMGGAALGALSERFAATRSELEAAASGEDDACSAEIRTGEGALREEFRATEEELDQEEGALAAEEARVTELYDSDQSKFRGKIEAVEHALGAAYRATDGELQRRVDERRAANQDTEAELAASQGELCERLAAAREQLTQQFGTAQTELEREAAERTADLAKASAVERTTQERITRISGYLENRSQRPGDALARRIRQLERETPDLIRRSTELARIEREGAAADRTQAELDTAEPGLEAAEATLDQRRVDHANRVATREREAELLHAAEQRAADGLAAEIEAVKGIIERVTPTYTGLRAAKSRAIDRRFSGR